ncbi:hypothetical protein M9H77_02816 [Catharanthus roseus]|uniref:Uncharacterized protein n=1 Tax=Catharanthus roseus TaxID=4058 RepID=A0ACC0C9W5_CATRO|nr:hypothetical protein M9H77_02816 [Catharanthus roseus]
MSTGDELLTDFVFEAYLLRASHAALSKMYEDERRSKHLINERGMDMVKTVEEEEGSASRKKKKLKRSPDNTNSIGSWSSI